MNLFNIAQFRKDLNNALFNLIYQNDIEPETIWQLIIDFQLCDGDIQVVQHHLNILSMYSKEAAQDILIHPTLLITIDNDEKILAWVLRQYDIKDLEKFSCDVTKFVI